MNIKNILKRLINGFGYDIRPLTLESHKIRRTIGESYSLIRDLGFQPRTVVDVGVASGTEELYRAFPDSHFLLIEPLKEFEPDLISILKRYKGVYVLAAAGSTSGQITFNMHLNHPEGSSRYKENMGVEADGCEIVVPMIRVDDILKDQQLNGPYLIKVDAQGAELDVLEGAQQALLETEAVALEVSLFEFMKGTPQFFDVVSYMKNHDFVAYDIIPGWNRPLDNALGQIDILFVKDSGMFRRDHAYSTIEQMKELFGSYNTHGHTLRFPPSEKAQFVTECGIEMFQPTNFTRTKSKSDQACAAVRKVLA
jgi:FkbM family methyltransferase